ncbi:MAG TPA: zinc ABC transporter substrate-binding protein [Porticoccaceae bacterium]|nr:zinc ABC transporter substrate-binding protein [Porticoccaceae bacterium]HCO61703.1 zinc ABC transporter substrate-binding protein [Porticoccaceae bacterium]
MSLKNVRWVIPVVSVLLMATMFANPAHGSLRVFACEPEWAALAEQLGGDQVRVFTATTAFQDPHHIEARPSLIAKARRAGVLICTGAELEIGWLPLLLRQSGNADIQPGQPGHFLAAEQVERLEVLENVDRSAGDVHAAGNPHVHLDPYRLLRIARAFAERLSEVDPDQANVYRSNFATFKQRWQEAIQGWESMATALKGSRVVVHHSNFSYLLDWLDMEVVADLEPKPGLPPTTAHLVRVQATVKAEKPAAILLSTYHNDKPARWLADRSDLPLVRLPFTIGGNDDAKDLFSLYQTTVSLLLEAQSQTGQIND